MFTVGKPSTTASSFESLASSYVGAHQRRYPVESLPRQCGWEMVSRPTTGTEEAEVLDEQTLHAKKMLRRVDVVALTMLALTCLAVVALLLVLGDLWAGPDPKVMVALALGIGAGCVASMVYADHGTDRWHRIVERATRPTQTPVPYSMVLAFDDHTRALSTIRRRTLDPDVLVAVAAAEQRMSVLMARVPSATGWWATDGEDQHCGRDRYWDTMSDLATTMCRMAGEATALAALAEQTPSSHPTGHPPAGFELADVAMRL